MQKKSLVSRGGYAAVAAASAVMAMAPIAASAQDYSSEPMPPEGQYLDAPQDWGDTYNDNWRRYDEQYAQNASDWAYRNCVQERQGNAVAGAVVGGVLGAVVGSNVAGRHNRTEGAIVGGALGATAGAAVGANSGSSVGCPPGYVMRAGATPYYYGGPTYGAPVVYAAPAWYRPWVFVGNRWVYRPYRSYYWGHRNYWRPRRGGVVCHIDHKGRRICR